LGHLHGFLANREVQVMAVCDVVQERLDHARLAVEQKYAEEQKDGRYHGVRAVKDFRELLDRPDIDAVVISTPDHWHAIPAILAARAGKHIYCEKPLTHHVSEGRRLVEEVANAKVAFQTGSQQRSEFNGHFRRAVEYVWNGRIGRLQRIRIGVGGPAKACDLPTQEIPAGTDWEMWVGPAPMRGYHEILCPRGVHTHFPQWRAYQEFAGGSLADIGAHHFDIAQWAMKTDTTGPTRVLCPRDGSPERGLTFVYPSGIEMIHNVFEGDVKADCVFEGTEGKILVSRKGISSLPESILEEPLLPSDQRVLPSSNHHQNWLEAIRNSSPTICPAEIGHRSATICHLANIGYRLGRDLRWDPQRELFMDDPEANQLLTREPRAPWRM
jgi:predicted dehydrogenase